MYSSFASQSFKSREDYAAAADRLTENLPWHLVKDREYSFAEHVEPTSKQVMLAQHMLRCSFHDDPTRPCGFYLTAKELQPGVWTVQEQQTEHSGHDVRNAADQGGDLDDAVMGHSSDSEVDRRYPRSSAGQSRPIVGRRSPPARPPFRSRSPSPGPSNRPFFVDSYPRGRQYEDPASRSSLPRRRSRSPAPRRSSSSNRGNRRRRDPDELPYVQDHYSPPRADSPPRRPQSANVNEVPSFDRSGKANPNAIEISRPVSAPAAAPKRSLTKQERIAAKMARDPLGDKLPKQGKQFFNKRQLVYECMNVIPLHHPWKLRICAEKGRVIELTCDHRSGDKRSCTGVSFRVKAEENASKVWTVTKAVFTHDDGPPSPKIPSRPRLPHVAARVDPPRRAEQTKPVEEPSRAMRSSRSKNRVPSAPSTSQAIVIEDPESEEEEGDGFNKSYEPFEGTSDEDGGEQETSGSGGRSLRNSTIAKKKKKTVLLQRNGAPTIDLRDTWAEVDQQVQRPSRAALRQQQEREKAELYKASLADTEALQRKQEEAIIAASRSAIDPDHEFEAFQPAEADPQSSNHQASGVTAVLPDPHVEPPALVLPSRHNPHRSASPPLPAVIYDSPKPQPDNDSDDDPVFVSSTGPSKDIKGKRRESPIDLANESLGLSPPPNSLGSVSMGASTFSSATPSTSSNSSADGECRPRLGSPARRLIKHHTTNVTLPSLQARAKDGAQIFRPTAVASQPMEVEDDSSPSDIECLPSPPTKSTQNPPASAPVDPAPARPPSAELAPAALVPLPAEPRNFDNDPVFRELHALLNPS